MALDGKLGGLIDLRAVRIPLNASIERVKNEQK